MTPRPFTIRVPDDVLNDLRARLDRGTDLAYLKDLVAYWRDSYDWRRHEAELNRLRQFTVPLAGIDVHFVHEAGVGPAPLPAILQRRAVDRGHRVFALALLRPPSQPLADLRAPARYGADGLRRLPARDRALR